MMIERDETDTEWPGEVDPIALAICPLLTFVSEATAPDYESNTLLRHPIAPPTHSSGLVPMVCQDRHPARASGCVKTKNCPTSGTFELSD
jgi:hypothetical protein